ncbi:hypothetical protein PROVRETT_08163 [Providencia rettgeri DSM 1131]|nr:hypothetical protein PROVRETT_08163 [Providencia rettgeri DSM 1131]
MVMTFVSDAYCPAGTIHVAIPANTKMKNKRTYGFRPSERFLGGGVVVFVDIVVIEFPIGLLFIV